MRIGRWLARSLLLAATACSGTDQTVGVTEDYELNRGVMDPYLFYWNEPTIIVPEEALVSQSVSISVTTFGDGCRREGPTQIVTNEWVTTVEPYDSVCVSCRVCTRELRMFEHLTVVQYAAPGEATIRIVGALAPDDTVGIVERHIIVRDP